MATLTIQPDAAAGQDAYIRNGIYAGNNFGVSNLLIGEINSDTTTARLLIKFDLSSLSSSAVFSSVIFSLYANADLSSNARTFRVYRLKRAWVEGTQDNVANTTGASWNDYSVGNAWQTAGGFGTDDCEQTDIGSRAFTATETLNQFKDFTLTPTTKASLDLGNGWLIKADTEANDAYAFASSDDATAANRPKLVIVYKVPSPVIGTSSGIGSATGTLKGKASVDSSISAVATVTGVASAAGMLVVAVAATSSVTGTLTATGNIVADAQATAAESARLTATGYLQGSAAGTSTVAARPVGDVSLFGSSLAIATESAILTARGYAEASTSGSATVVAAIMALGTLAGSSVGNSTATLDNGLAIDLFTEEVFIRMFIGHFKAMR